MCTAATYQTKDFYFGRNLDYEFGYGETVTFTPRHYPFQLNGLGVLDQHYAILGMACVQNNYPLYYDAINEKGLCIAGLNFVGNAWYCKDEPGKDNVAQFELIPWLLGRCATAAEARDLLAESRITDDAFLPGLPPARLHWLLADREQCFAVEQTAADSGLDRGAAETAGEFAVRIVTHRSTVRRDAEDLLRLYEGVRFGSHRVSEPERDAARTCLRHIEEAWR